MSASDDLLLELLDRLVMGRYRPIYSRFAFSSDRRSHRHDAIGNLSSHHMKPQARPFVVEIKRRGKKLATANKASIWPDPPVSRSSKEGSDSPPAPGKVSANPIEITVLSGPAAASAAGNTEEGRTDDTVDIPSQDNPER